MIKKEYKMEQEKIYIVVIDEVYSYEDLGSRTAAFKEEDSAKSFFHTTVEKSRKEAKEEGWEIDENDNYFCAWEEGYYTGNHIECYIKEVLVR